MLETSELISNTGSKYRDNILLFMLNHNAMVEKFGEVQKPLMKTSFGYDYDRKVSNCYYFCISGSIVFNFDCFLTNFLWGSPGIESTSGDRTDVMIINHKLHSYRPLIQHF